MPPLLSLYLPDMYKSGATKCSQETKKHTKFHRKAVTRIEVQKQPFPNYSASATSSVQGISLFSVPIYPVKIMPSSANTGASGAFIYAH